MKKNSYSFAEHFSDTDRFGLHVQEFWRDAGQIAIELATAANRGDDLSTYWISRLIEENVSHALLRDIFDRVSDVYVTSKLELDIDKKEFSWVYGPENFDVYPNAEKFCALMLVHLINAGIVEKVKQCERDECGNFFVGNKKARYCDDKCGSIIRARKMRKQNKARQALWT